MEVFGGDVSETTGEVSIATWVSTAAEDPDGWGEDAVAVMNVQLAITTYKYRKPSLHFKCVQLQIFLKIKNSFKKTY